MIHFKYDDGTIISYHDPKDMYDKLHEQKQRAIDKSFLQGLIYGVVIGVLVMIIIVLIICIINKLN